MAGKEDPMRNLRASGRTPAEKGQQQQQGDADLVSGGLTACAGGHTPAAEKEETTAGAKTNADDEEVGGCTDAGEKAVAAAAAANTEASKIKYVEMPKEFLSWILAQERETAPLSYDPRNFKFLSLSEEEIERDLELVRQANARLQANDDEFFGFQAWVRDKYEKNGRVMVPEEFLVRGPYRPSSTP